jgi:hypothetical protein
MDSGARLGCWLTLGSIAIAACGETSDHPPPQVQDGGVDEVFRNLADRYCAALFECPGPNDDTLGQAVAFGSQARCREVLDRAYRGGLVAGWEDLRRRERDGSIRVNLEAAARCFENQSCQHIFDFPQGACREIFVGTVAEGQPCLRSEQCAGNSYCDQSQSACPGVCRLRKTPGSPCVAEDECGVHGSGWAYCGYDDASGNGICVERVARPAAEGQACTIATGIMTEIAVCTAGLWCDDTPNGTSICRKPLVVGQPCDTIDDVCVTGAFCHGPAGQRTCQTVELVGAGESCARADSEPPQSCDVFSGTTCDAGSQICTATGGSRGARCDTSDLGDLIPCDDGLYCEASTQTCQPQVADGQPCNSNRQCSSGECSSSAKVCATTYCHS